MANAVVCPGAMVVHLGNTSGSCQPGSLIFRASQLASR